MFVSLEMTKKTKNKRPLPQLLFCLADLSSLLHLISALKRVRFKKKSIQTFVCCQLLYKTLLAELLKERQAIWKRAASCVLHSLKRTMWVSDMWYLNEASSPVVFCPDIHYCIDISIAVLTQGWQHHIVGAALSLPWASCRERIHHPAFIEYFNVCQGSNHCVVLLFLSEQWA